jgi:AraC-like DNA-binding protein
MIALFLTAMLASMVASFSHRDIIFSQIWALIASTGTSGLYVLLTCHIIRRTYLLYSLHPVSQKSRNKKTGRRVFSGELTRKRLEEWFREKKPYLDSEFKITDAVEAMDVNRSVISSFINIEYGMNFNRFVNRWRLEEVNRLSEQSGVDASKLWAQAGFSEARQYYRAKLSNICQ